MITRLRGWFSVKFVPSLLLRRFKSKTAKRIFFLKQYEATMKRIWGEEFVLEGVKEGREILRREYDKLVETRDAAKVGYEKNEASPDPDKTLREQFEKLLEVKSKEIEEWKKKIDENDRVLSELEDRISSFYDNLPKLEKKINE